LTHENCPWAALTQILNFVCIFGGYILLLLRIPCSILIRKSKIVWYCSYPWCNRIIRKRYSTYAENWTPLLVLTLIIIFFMLSLIQTTYAFTFNSVDSTRLLLSDAQKSLAPYGINIGRIILYSIVIVIVILTRLKWTKHGRKITKPIIIVESIFYLALSSIVIFDSLYNVGVPILYLVPYLILFFGLQQYSYLRSNRLISFWRESKSASIYVKGGTHIHAVFVIGTASRIIISILFIGSLFGPSQHGIIDTSNSTVVLATTVFDLLLMISVGLLIGINRRIFIRYNLIN